MKIKPIDVEQSLARYLNRLNVLCNRSDVQFKIDLDQKKDTDFFPHDKPYNAAIQTLPTTLVDDPVLSPTGVPEIKRLPVVVSPKLTKHSYLLATRSVSVMTLRLITDNAESDPIVCITRVLIENRGCGERTSRGDGVGRCVVRLG